mmetsp:Transcript_3879/g.10105  ORF Transcript_3879/g.10105 Transcript_3879/m.10105 type:complete len:227 (-) Transcript_3879:195-875(-)
MGITTEWWYFWASTRFCRCISSRTALPLRRLAELALRAAACLRARDSSSSFFSSSMRACIARTCASSIRSCAPGLRNELGAEADLSIETRLRMCSPGAPRLSESRTLCTLALAAAWSRCWRSITIDFTSAFMLIDVRRFIATIPFSAASRDFSRCAASATRALTPSTISCLISSSSRLIFSYSSRVFFPCSRCRSCSACAAARARACVASVRSRRARRSSCRSASC